jgi:hypothetical protein
VSPNNPVSPMCKSWKPFAHFNEQYGFSSRSVTHFLPVTGLFMNQKRKSAPPPAVTLMPGGGTSTGFGIRDLWIQATWDAQRNQSHHICRIHGFSVVHFKSWCASPMWARMGMCDRQQVTPFQVVTARLWRFCRGWCFLVHSDPRIDHNNFAA